MVTIVVASFNNYKYLPRCLDSCLEQKYPELEILVVDDGSTDETPKIAAKYSDKGVRFIFKENGGLSSSRQIGLENANGNYICFIDADDTLCEEYISKLFESITKFDSDICVCNSSFFGKNGNRVKTPSIYGNLTDNCFDQRIYSHFGRSYTKLAREFSMCDSWNKMYRTAFLKNHGLAFRFPKGFNGSDLLFNHKVLMYKPNICTCSYCGYNHFVYDDSATGRKNKEMQKGNELLWESLRLESIKAGLDKVLFNQLCYLYYCLLRDAYQDELDSKGYDIGFLKKGILISSAFEKKNRIKKKGVSFYADLKLLLFYVIRKKPSLLIGYLKRRGGVF